MNSSCIGLLNTHCEMRALFRVRVGGASPDWGGLSEIRLMAATLSFARSIEIGPGWDRRDPSIYIRLFNKRSGPENSLRIPVRLADPRCCPRVAVYPLK